MEISRILIEQRNYFNSGNPKDLDFRLNALRKLSASINQNEIAILDALKADLNKSDIEGYMTEISNLQGELKFVIRNLPGWVKKRKVKTTIVLFPAKCYTIAEPYGVVLIMSPWNYPLLLALDPLVGAIAAGNCAIIKPSQYSPQTSAIINKIISECFPPEYCAVVEGGRDVNAEILKQRFDYIFFTGSTAVGKVVMEAAAKNLTPLSLELGGKSPAIIDETADIKLAAKKLVFGKYINAGQTCVAPDYVLVHASREELLISELTFWINKFYSRDSLSGGIADYPRIINQKHFDRLLGLMAGERIAYGGGTHPETRTIDPTVLTDIRFDSPVMQEEIFGPLLPILTYSDADEMINLLRDKPKPLALYLFTSNKDFQKRILKDLSFGGGCINDVILQVASPHLGFGGVGNSGMGSYHGKDSFDTFTHYKSIVEKETWLDVPFRYRPYTKITGRLLGMSGKNK